MSECIECGGEAELQHHINYAKDETVPMCYSCHGTVHADPEHPLYPVDDGDYGANLCMDDATKDRLRRYKAQDGQTYAEAINELLDAAGWEDG